MGNESVVVAVAANRGVDIVLNMACNRATPVYVTFAKDRGHRLFGEVARDAHASHASCTVHSLKRLIGRRYDDPVVQHERATATMACVETADGMVACRVATRRRSSVDGDGWTVADESFTPVELLSAFLAFIRREAAKSLRTDVSECVLACPTFFRQAQREALLEAARLAQWRVLRLVHETSAALVAYGLSRRIDAPHTVAIVDVGHAHLQVAFARVRDGAGDVLAYAHDEHVGGRSVDERLACVVDADGRAATTAKGRLRVLRECERAKRVLSTNQEVVLSIECVTDAHGVTADLHARLTRAQLEHEASGLLDALERTLSSGMRTAGLERVDRVELVGGASRMPCVVARVASTLGHEPMRTLDASECVAKGCAFVAAMLSPRFQVRPFAVADISLYAIRLCVDATVETLYPANALLDCTKKIGLSVASSTTVRCIYHAPADADDDRRADDDRTVGECLVVAPDEPAVDAASDRRRVRLVVTLDPSGLVRFVTIRPVRQSGKSSPPAGHVAPWPIRCRYRGQLDADARADVERRLDWLDAYDADAARCDELRNQLAARLCEARPRLTAERVDALSQAIDDETSTVAVLTGLLQAMSDDDHPSQPSPDRADEESSSASHVDVPSTTDPETTTTT